MIISIETDEAIGIFERAVSAGGFDNAVEQYLDDNFRSPIRDTFYSQTLKEQGKDAAEARLREWASVNTSHRVANTLTSIATGIVQLANIDHYGCSIKSIPKADNSIFPFPWRSTPDTFAIAVRNPQLQGCGCNQPRGAVKFSPYGELGITSYAAVIDPGDPRNNCIVLMLPARVVKENTSSSVALVLSRIGEMKSHRYDVVLYKDAAEYLMFGEERLYRTASASGGYPCEYVGFPGAEEYITSSLSELPGYLEYVALELNGEHEH